MRRVLSLILAAAGIALAAIATAASARALGMGVPFQVMSPPAGTFVPSTFFGMHISSLSSDWPTAPAVVGALGKCGGTTWPYLEASSGTYTWTNLDYCLSTAQSHGVSLFYSSDCTSSGCTAGIPTWSSCATLATDYGNFYQQLVSRYGAQLIYELWNEPDSVKNGGACTAAQLAAAMNAAHNEIRSLAPTATILAASGTPSYMTALYNAGLTQDVDAITFHDYTDGISEGAGSPTTPEGVITGYGAMKTAMAAFPNLAHKPVWMTEGAAYTGYTGGAGIPSSQSVMAAYIARYETLLASLGVVRAYWYEWDNTEWGPIEPSGNPYPAAVTGYEQIENWLTGSTLGACSVAGDGVTYTCPLTEPNGHKGLIVWDAAGSESYTPPAAALYKQYRDLTGATTAYSGGPVTAGAGPIIFDN